MTRNRCFITQCPTLSTTCSSPTRYMIYLFNSQHEDDYLDNNFIPSFNMEFLKHQQQVGYPPHRAKPRMKRADSIGSLGGESDGERSGKKRFQVKIACIHCKKACKKCDDVRPCTRYAFLISNISLGVCELGSRTIA
jgi:hypothetical protein